MDEKRFEVGFRPARRSQARMRLAIAGPSGSGKTYSALLIARGLVGPKGRIAVIDTERGSASLYADLTPFDVCELGPPFLPEKYTAAIRAAERAGYDAIILDSISHAWAGPGGILDIHDAVVARQKEKNSWAAWRDVTPRHNELVDAMLQSPCHIIATIRSKQEYAQVDEGGRKKVVKLGLAPVQRDGIEYEFTVVLDLDAGHNAVASKDRTSLFDGQVFRPSEETGRILRDWLAGASSGSRVRETAKPAEPAEPVGRAGPVAREAAEPAGPAGEPAGEPEAGGGAPEGPASEAWGEPYEGQVIVLSPPEETPEGWRVEVADTGTDEALILAGGVRDMAEGTVWRVKGVREGVLVRVGSAEAVSQPVPHDGALKVEAVLKGTPKVSVRRSNGREEKVIWARAEVSGEDVILTGDAVRFLKEGQAVALLAREAGRANDGSRMYEVLRVA